MPIVNKGMVNALYNRKLDCNKTVFVAKKNCCYTTNPIVEGKIVPDMPVTTHKISMRTAHKLGYHNSGEIADKVKCVTLNSGYVIEPLKEDIHVFVSEAEKKQFMLLVDTACKVFIQQHGWLSCKGVKTLLKTYGYPIDNQIVSKVVNDYHAMHGKALKHNARSTNSLDMAVRDSFVDYTKRSSSYNTRLNNIIKCCYR